MFIYFKKIGQNTHTYYCTLEITKVEYLKPQSVPIDRTRAIMTTDKKNIDHPLVHPRVFFLLQSIIIFYIQVRSIYFVNWRFIFKCTPGHKIGRLSSTLDSVVVLLEEGDRGIPPLLGRDSVYNFVFRTLKK